MYLVLRCSCADDSADCDTVGVRLSQEFFDDLQRLLDVYKRPSLISRLTELRVLDSAGAAIYAMDCWSEAVTAVLQSFEWPWYLGAESPSEPDADQADDRQILVAEFRLMCLPGQPFSQLVADWVFCVDGVDAPVESAELSLAQWAEVAAKAGYRFEVPQ